MHLINEINREIENIEKDIERFEDKIVRLKEARSLVVESSIINIEGENNRNGYGSISTAIRNAVLMVPGGEEFTISTIYTLTGDVGRTNETEMRTRISTYLTRMVGKGEVARISKGIFCRIEK